MLTAYAHWSRGATHKPFRLRNMLDEASLGGRVQLHAVEHAASRCLELSRDMACCFICIYGRFSNKLLLIRVDNLSWTCMQWCPQPHNACSALSQSQECGPMPNEKFPVDHLAMRCQFTLRQHNVNITLDYHLYAYIKTWLNQNTGTVHHNLWTPQWASCQAVECMHTIALVLKAYA